MSTGMICDKMPALRNTARRQDGRRTMSREEQSISGRYIDVKREIGQELANERDDSPKLQNRGAYATELYEKYSWSKLEFDNSPPRVTTDKPRRSTKDDFGCDVTDTFTVIEIEQKLKPNRDAEK